MAALMRKLLLIVVVAVSVGAARAADCPQPACFTKPPTLVVPFAPGGPLDALARYLAKSLREPLGQDVIVENKAGAGGSIAAEMVARSRSDSHTILIGPTTLVTLNGILFKTPGFDAARDLMPVTLVADARYILVLNPSVPANQVRELVDLTKNNPNKYFLASSGRGSVSHLLGEQLKAEAGARWTHVPYKGLGPATADILGGGSQAMFMELSAALPHINAGKLKAIAVTGERRSPLTPNVPTFADAGFNGYQSNVAYGLFYPAGTHENIVSRLASAVRFAQSQPQFKEALAKLGLEAAAAGPESFAAHLRADGPRWAKVVKEGRVTVD